MDDEYSASLSGRVPDLDIVRSFVAVCDRNGFTKASEHLARTQSTISLHIKRLEDLYGCALFVRGKRKVALTTEGELLLGYSKRMLQLHEEASARLRGTHVAGVVRIGIPEDFATFQLPLVLKRFAAMHIGVRLEVRSAVTADLMASMGNGDLEAVVARRGVGNEGGQVIWREPLVWAAPRIDRIEQQRPLPLAMFPHGCVYRPIVLQLLDQSSIPWRIAYTSTSLTGIQAALVAGLGVTVLARSTVTQEMRVIDGEALPAPPQTEIAVFRRNENTPACDALVSYIQESFEEASNLAALGR